MKPEQLTRELRRIARREVPNGEPDLWPGIRRQISLRRTPYSSPGSPGTYVRAEGEHGSTELSSVYVWSAESRPSRFGNGARLLAAGAALALVVALLTIMLGNHGSNGDKQPVGAVASATATASPVAQSLSWTSSGHLTIPLESLGGSNIQASVDVQIMPSGDLRLSTSVSNSIDIVTWHVVTQTCENVTSLHEQALSDQDVVPSFQQYGSFYAFIPAGKTHQPLTLAVFNQKNSSPVACATIPAVPATLAVGYPPASTVPPTCPVTLPSQPTFIPPATFPADPTRPLYGDYWHGTSDLWVGLPLDGVWKQDVQIFYWSASFNPSRETRPALTVGAKRLDGDSMGEPFIDYPTASNGGMLVSVTFPTTGCWRVTGQYQGHSLSFVVWVESSISPQTPTSTPAVTQSWDGTGKLTLPVEPLVTGGAQGSIDAQIMPDGDVRLSPQGNGASQFLVWHAINQTCQQVASHDNRVTGTFNVIPAFSTSNGNYAFIPAAKSHQQIALVATNMSGGAPLACAMMPAVPNHLVVGYLPAPDVPRTCPVTLPTEPAFTPPGNISDEPPNRTYGDYWYGSPALWTALPLDGVWNPVKTFWWSENYNFTTEPNPALNITAKQLDGNGSPVVSNRATNGEAGGVSPFMLTGVDLTSGCWQVTGTYKGQSLSFVVWVQDASATSVNQAPGPVPVTTPTPGADGLTHTDLACHASSFGPSSAQPTDINVEFRGTASSGQFWAIVYQELPIFANQTVDLALKLQASGPLILTAEDGLEITPLTGPTAAEEANWPRPGNAWIASFNFPHSGCWHLQARAGNVTGDLWLEVFAQPDVATPVAAATATPAPVTISQCVDNDAATLLNQFVAAYNQNDQAALTAMLA